MFQKPTHFLAVWTALAAPPPPLYQDMWKKWEPQQTVKKGGGISKGGTRLVRYTQQFHCTPKLIPPVG